MCYTRECGGYYARSHSKVREHILYLLHKRVCGGYYAPDSETFFKALEYMVSGSDAVSQASIKSVANSGDIRVILKSLDAVKSSGGGELKNIDGQSALATFEMLETCISNDETGERAQV